MKELQGSAVVRFLRIDPMVRGSNQSSDKRFLKVSKVALTFVVKIKIFQFFLKCGDPTRPPEAWVMGPWPLASMKQPLTMHEAVAPACTDTSHPFYFSL